MFGNLRVPFAAEDIEWRVQKSGMKDDRPWAMVLAYVNNRAIMDRLDYVVGAANWCNRFAPGPDGGIVCGISIRIGDEWVTKWDGADNTVVEAVKGGLSGAMKRAAVQWGIGRYLYRLSAMWANFNDNGKNRDGIKASNSDQKRYFKWDGPALPEWAMPGTKAAFYYAKPEGEPATEPAQPDDDGGNPQAPGDPEEDQAEFDTKGKEAMSKRISGMAGATYPEQEPVIKDDEGLF